jgi:hypothetical protein
MQLKKFANKPVLLGLKLVGHDLVHTNPLTSHMCTRKLEKNFANVPVFT